MNATFQYNTVTAPTADIQALLRTEAQAPTQGAPLAFALVGQSIAIDTAPIEPLMQAHNDNTFTKGVAHLQERRELLTAFANSECLSEGDIAPIHQALIEQASSLGHVVDSALTHAMNHIEQYITDNVMGLLGDTTSFHRFNRGIKAMQFYGMSCDTEATFYTEDTGLMVFATDFYTHLYTGIDTLDNTPLSRLYVTFLERLSSYVGVWQSDVATLYQDVWSNYSPTLALKIEEFKEHLSHTRSISQAKSALGESAEKLADFFESIEESLWMATANEELEDISDDDIDTLMSEIDQHVSLAKVAAKRHALVQSGSLLELVNTVDRSDAKANALCEIVERVTPFCNIDAPCTRMRNTMEVVGEGMEYMGVVLQEVSSNSPEHLNDASQNTYEHLMNAGEAEEILKVDLSDPHWKTALAQFTVAVTSLAAASLTMTDW